MSRAVEAAKTDSIRLGYNVDGMDVLADSANTVWTLFLVANPPPSRTGTLLEKLGRRVYWAVYFSPRTDPGVVQLGGDLFVFVDRTDGSIIGALRGT
jgi:hypothetical protein